MPDKSFGKLYGIWEKFINGEDNLTGLNEEVAASWKRCRARGLDPYGETKVADRKTILELERKNRYFTEVVMPFVELIEKFVQNTGFIITVVDKDGFILDVKGDKQAIEQARNTSLCRGGCRSEEAAGTNAISLALSGNKPFQIVGPEHFRASHHQWTCSAAPIHDTSGNILGVLNLAGHRLLLHKQTLGMVVSLATVIEREFVIRQRNATLQLTTERLEDIVDAVPEGVIAIDKTGAVLAGNAEFRDMFAMTKSELDGANIASVFGQSFSLLGLLKKAQEYSDREENLSAVNSPSIPSMVTGRIIVDGRGDVAGAVGIIKERKEAFRLANRIVGAEAIFSFDSIIHQDQQMAKIIKAAKAVAGTDTRVLIEGERGTGKEMFAQAIHNASPRNSRPFVTVNCGVIPRELIEGELFGYVEGTFKATAKCGKPGKLELADGGTLFLDEVNSMPLDMQVKLLRVLEQNEVTRLGGKQATAFNVRVIAASNKPLEALVKEGYFRLDLYYLLGVMILKIPPLRERVKDIPPLFSLLLDRISRSLGKTTQYSLEALAPALCSYDWPGNVRELESYIERAVVLAQDGPVTLQHFPEKMLPKNGDYGTANNYLAITEKEAIGKILEIYNGNISKAAKSLGISRNTLYNKIKAYGLEVL